MQQSLDFGVNAENANAEALPVDTSTTVPDAIPAASAAEPLQVVEQTVNNMHVVVLLGGAGTGKSTLLREQLKLHRLVLTATTGVAAYNLGEGATTINSLLGYYNAASLHQNMCKGWWSSYKYDQLKNIDGVAIDEISMMRGDVLDLQTSFFMQINRWRQAEGLPPLKLLLIGDFCQLPPIQQKDEIEPNYAFRSGWWNDIFAPNVTLLKHIHRQNDPYFQSALASARRGDGMSCALTLKSRGCRYTPQPFYGFRGFSLYPTNQSVELHNRTRLGELETEGYTLQCERWGDQTEDLKEVPDMVGLKQSCRIRVTANETPGFSYANGQLGTLVEYSPEFGPLVLLDGVNGREDYEVRLHRHVRFAYRPVAPSQDKALIEATAWMGKNFVEHLDSVLIPQRITPFYDPRREMVAIGAVMYYPIVLGYASTFHKAQGLTLENVQIDIRNQMAGRPQMMYVAMSRARSIDGLLIVGDEQKLARRIQTAQAVYPFI